MKLKISSADSHCLNYMNYTGDYLQTQEVPQRDRGGHSPLAGHGPWLSHSFPLWHQTVLLCGHMILEKEHQMLVTQNQAKPFHPCKQTSICSVT